MDEDWTEFRMPPDAGTKHIHQRLPVSGVRQMYGCNPGLAGCSNHILLV